ncbi:hypothetical protein C8J31_1693 [Rhizobium sp. PP-CC-2G-626]|nr:hypothetical protein C8J31_1693 [Rhizobium sp. PP-CC-2G-626]
MESTTFKVSSLTYGRGIVESYNRSHRGPLHQSRHFPVVETIVSG